MDQELPDKKQLILLDYKMPFTFRFPSIPNLKLRAEHIHQRHLTQLQAIWSQVSSSGDGLSNEEDFDFMVEHVFKDDAPGYSSAVIVNSDNNDIIAALAMFPSNMCRSEHPVYCRSILVVNKVYRGRKIAENILKFYNSFLDQAGYRGALARVTVIARSILPSVVSLLYISYCMYIYNSPNSPFDNFT